MQNTADASCEESDTMFYLCAIQVQIRPKVGEYCWVCFLHPVKNTQVEEKKEPRLLKFVPVGNQEKCECLVCDWVSKAYG